MIDQEQVLLGPSFHTLDDSSDKTVLGPQSVFTVCFILSAKIISSPWERRAGRTLLLSVI